MEIVVVRTEVNDEGVMVVHSEKGREVYEMTKKPTSTSYLVEREMADILDGLGLEDVLIQLSRASDLLHLAYMGVAGTGKLAGRIGKRERELAQLCVKCDQTMSALQKGSGAVLEVLMEAYVELLKAREVDALEILSDCAEEARKMAAKCEELASGFGKMRDDTDADIVAVDEAVGVQVETVKKLTEAYRKNEAERLEALKKTELLKPQIEKIERYIADAKETEKEERDRAFKLGIIGATVGPLFQAVGQIASVYGRPPFSNLLQGSTASTGVKDVTEDSGQHKTKNATVAGVDVKKFEEDRNAAERKQKAASEVKQTLKEKLFLANADREAKQNRYNEAVDADKAAAGYAEKVERAEAELKTSSKSLATLQARQDEADKALEAAGEALKIAGEKIAESTKQMKDEANDRAKETSSERRQLVQQSIAMEEERRAALVHLAGLTSLLQSNLVEQSIEKESRVALELARAALSSLYTAFLEAKKFWDRITVVCETMSDPRIGKQVQRLVRNGESVEDRKQFYRSERFVTQAVTLLCRWAALSVVCGRYVEASRTAYDSVSKNIKESPSIEMAKERRGPLATRILGEISTATTKSIEKTAKLEEDANSADK